MDFNRVQNTPYFSWDFVFKIWFRPLSYRVFRETGPRPVHAPLVSYTWFLKTDHAMTNFMLVWWVNLCRRRKLLRSLFSSLLSFALSTKIQSRIYCREEFDRCKFTAWIRLASNLVVLRSHPCQEMFVITWFLFWITWIKPTVLETAGKKLF